MSIIVRPTLCYHKFRGLDLIHDSVYFVDPSAPPALVVSLQWLRLAKAVKGAALDVLDERIDPPQGFLVLGLPVEVILPAFGEKQQIKHRPPPSSPAPLRTF